MTDQQSAEPEGCGLFESDYGRYLLLWADVPPDHNVESFTSDVLIPWASRLKASCRQFNFQYVPKPKRKADWPNPFCVHAEFQPDHSVVKDMLKWRIEFGQQLRSWLDAGKIGTYYYGIKDADVSQAPYGGPAGLAIWEQVESIMSQFALNYAKTVGDLRTSPLRTARISDLILCMLNVCCAHLSQSESIDFMNAYTLMRERINVRDGLPALAPDFRTQVSDRAQKLHEKLSFGKEVGDGEWRPMLDRLTLELRPLGKRIEAEIPSITKTISFVEWLGVRVFHPNFFRFYFDNVAEATILHCLSHLLETRQVILPNVA